MAVYGPDWRKPNKNWTFENDQYNMKLRGTIEDMTADRLAVEQYLKIHPIKQKQSWRGFI